MEKTAYPAHQGGFYVGFVVFRRPDQVGIETASPSARPVRSNKLCLNRTRSKRVSREGKVRIGTSFREPLGKRLTTEAVFFLPSTERFWTAFKHTERSFAD
jgi:hypothetical protein